jgi:NADPH:quinone reductase-like Zn-dependent oxidoreductase
MRAAFVKTVGSLDNLEFVELPEPKPGPGEVLVRLRAAALNFRDLVAIVGGYGKRQKRDNLVPLSDGAGEVVAIGSGVNKWNVGERVVGCFFPNWQSGPATEAGLSAALGGSVDGVACEYRVFAENAIAAVPEHMSFVEAATLPCAGLTAWVATMAVGGVAPGRTVLTQGSGGVSVFALQFSRLAGAEVIATSSSAEKLEKLRSLGAGNTINYVADPQWGQTVQLLQPGGVDLVVEIGGGGTMAQSLQAVRIGGAICVIGVTAGARHDLNIPVLLMKNAHLHGISVGSRDQFLEMLRAVVLHRLRPVIDRTFALADLRTGLEYLKSGKHVGKVCIEI